MLNYPSLHQEPRYAPAGVIPLNRDRSHLDWLAAHGRLIARQREETEDRLLDSIEDLSDLLDVEEDIFEGTEVETDQELDTLDEEYLDETA
ncbi:MAG: DUF3134 domain-containing protein [Hydrococcus sp. C42_A2020_068]|nr:DUF3134 domain-containing protein [Hydrococcus sp. C42_A2020_068]